MIVFFEIDKVNIERFYFKRLEKDFDYENMVIVIEDPQELKSFKKAYPKIKSYLFLEWIRKHSKNYKNSYVFINGNRIPDLLMSKISHENNCKVIFIQHGMYVDFMKREIQLFFKKLRKSIRYLFYAFKTGELISLFKIHVFGYSRSLTSNCKIMYPDSAFVYSLYWKDWHNKIFFHGNTKDYYLLRNNDKNQSIIKLENSVVYCYQTLVEDGRIDAIYFKSVVNEIIKTVKELGMNLVVKGHPRMSELSKKYFLERDIRLVFNEFPSSGVVIGHYSTLLARWVYEKDMLFIVELDGHEIPEPVEKLAYRKCTVESLSGEMKKLNKSKLELKKKESDFYFNYSDEHSADTIDEIISSFN